MSDERINASKRGHAASMSSSTGKIYRKNPVAGGRMKRKKGFSGFIKGAKQVLEYTKDIL